MPRLTRRSALASGLASGLATGLAGALPASIARAAGIGPDVRTGTLRDVAHVVILMQENRSFDHYFGTMRGVRGFGDRLAIPVPGPDGTSRPVWQQHDGAAPEGSRTVGPFHLSTRADFDLMRVEGTPHAWDNAHAAWDEGRMARWPEAKTRRTMAHFRREDLPFQFALAEAFTLCDAYHCSTQTGTNTNRVMLWTGGNDPAARAGGPAIGNSHDSLPADGGWAQGYGWTTVPELLSAAGVTWQIYQDMADNFTDNPLVGFDAYRAAAAGTGDPALRQHALTTRTPADLRADVLAGTLPQVSWIVATAEGSEHPGPSSPAQGADYTAQVLDALTANPAVWARTALLVMFDENDGFFDHVPPPAPPSRRGEALAGGSTVDLDGSYHVHPAPGEARIDAAAYRGRPYGLGPRVPLYVVSPWSRGGWVNSQVFDHTSVIRFLEARFGFTCPNITPWRRAVCGDLTSAFDFRQADRRALPTLPATAETAHRARAIAHQPDPAAPATPAPLFQEPGLRPARPLPYRLEVTERGEGQDLVLRFAAEGAAAVFHVHDRSRLAEGPRRYTVAAATSIEGRFAPDARGGFDVWVLGPNGFHRHFAGPLPATAPLAWRVGGDALTLDVARGGVVMEWLLPGGGSRRETLPAGPRRVSLAPALGWYDVRFSHPALPGWTRRVAGRNDLPGRVTTSDPFVEA
jgi:phospholipase C